MQLSASDLSNYLNCHHYTELDKLLLDGKIKKPEFNNPHVSALQERGFEHEASYVEYLRKQGLRVVEIPDSGSHSERQEQTLQAMKEGADIITQGVLKNDLWLGFADILKKVKRSSALGEFSYEVMDTKLSRETKAGTILQLSLYSEMLEKMQGSAPERMWVVSPAEGFQEVAYRINDFSSYYRLVRSQLIASLDKQQNTYPEPVAHCDICR